MSPELEMETVKQAMMVWMTVGFALVVLAASLFTYYLRRRVARGANRKIEGCLACGSLDLETSGEEIVCLACGYRGRVDQGGTMSVDEAGASIEHLGRKAASVLKNANFNL